MSCSWLATPLDLFLAGLAESASTAPAMFGNVARTQTPCLEDTHVHAHCLPITQPIAMQHDALPTAGRFRCIISQQSIPMLSIHQEWSHRVHRRAPWDLATLFDTVRSVDTRLWANEAAYAADLSR